MGHRYIARKALLDERYSPHRVKLMKNEADFESHRSKPYALFSKKFQYRSMFQVHTSRLINKSAERTAKKAVRQQAKTQIRKEQEQ